MHTRTTLSPCKNKNDRLGGRTRRARAAAPAPAALTVAVSLSFGSVPLAIAGPTGGVVVNGQGSISTPKAGTTVVNQSSNLLQLNWNTFNVSQGESVQFRQPTSTSVAFNRILDQNPSQIFGHVQGNGQVVLVNPNGFLIGRTAQLNVNSLVVSSLADMGYDPVSGRYRFSSSAASPGAVINQGTITAGHGGSVTLLGGTVSNSGTIVADYGTVNLAAGRVATLDLAGDGLLRLEVGSELSSNSSGAASAVENSGSISAAGGQVVLTASVLKDVFTGLINNTGVVRANRIDNSGGTIQLLGPEGDVSSSGTLDASAGDARSTGGTVTMAGNRVGLFGNALVDVSGAAGGGTAFIGGGDHGGNPDVPNAQETIVSSGATLNADAGKTGDGGHVVVWSNQYTQYDGNLSARGGSLSGNGGHAEVSGGALELSGGADLTAAHGAWGTLLLDPDQLEIDTNSPQPAGMSGQTYNYGDDSGQSTKIGTTAIASLLTTGSVTLEAQDFLKLDSTASLTANTANSLVLNSHGNIQLDGSIALTGGGGVTVATDGTSTVNPAGTLIMGSGSSISTGTGNISLTGKGDVTLGALSGTQVSVTSTAGNILNTNQGASPINATTLSLLAQGTTSTVGQSGTGNAIATQAGSLTATGAGGIFVSNSGGDLALTSAIANGTAGAVTITNSGGDIQVGTVTATGTVTLDDSSGANAIDNASVSSAINAGTAVLHAGSGIGTTGGALQTAVGALTATATNGAIDVANTGGPLTITQATATGTSGAVTVSNTGGDIQVGSITAAGAVTLDDSSGANAIDNVDGSSAIDAGTAILHAGSGIGTTGGALQTAVGALTATSTNGAVDVANTGGPLTITQATATGTSGAVTVNNAGGDIQVGSITAAGAVTLDDSSGANAINNSSVSSVIGAGTAVLHAGSGIGTTGGALQTAVGALTATSTNGAVDVANTGRPLTITQATATGTSGAVTVSNTGGGIQVGTITAAGAVSLDDSGGANAIDNVSVSSSIGAGTAVLHAGSGIGTTNGTLHTSVGALTATSTNGAVNVANTGSPLTITQVTATGTSGAVTVTNTGGGIQVGTITAAGTVTLDDSSGANAIDNSSVSSTIGAGTAVLHAGSGIGTTGGALQTAVGALTATSTNGAVDVANTGGPLTITQATATGTSGAVTVTNTGGDIQVGTVAAAGTVSLDDSGGANAIDNSSVSSTIGAGTAILHAGSGIGTTGGALQTAVGALTATSTNGAVDVANTGGPLTITQATASGTGGALTVTNTGGLLTVTQANSDGASGAVSITNSGGAIDAQVVSAAGTSGAVSLTDSSGNIQVGNVSANATSGSVTLDASGGSNTTLSIVDDVGASPVAAHSVTLKAGAGIGTVTNFATLAGAPVAVSTGTGGPLAAAVNSNSGQINLSIASGAPSIAAAGAGTGIVLGSGGGASGTVVLQSSGDLDLSNMAANAIGIRTGNTANVGLSANPATGTLTLPANTSVTDVAAHNLLVQGGADVVGGVSRTLSFAAGDLDFISGAAGGAMILNTSVSQLDAQIGNAASLTVNQASSLPLSLGALTDTGGAVTVGWNGTAAALTDDGNAATRVTASSLTLSAASVGQSSDRIQTAVSGLNITASTGDAYIDQSGAAALTASAGGTLDVQSSGTLTVGGTSGGATGVSLKTTGTGSDIDVNAAISAGTSAATLQAAGAVAGAGQITANGLTVSGTAIGTSPAARLNTAVTGTLGATSSNGGIYLADTAGGSLSLSAQATNGAVDAQSAATTVSVTSATGTGVTLNATGINADLALGTVSGGNADVTLLASGALGHMDIGGAITNTTQVTATAGTVGSPGVINSTGGNVSTGTFTATGAVVGNGTPIATSAPVVVATANNGGIDIHGTGASLNLTATANGGGVQATSDGAMTVSSVDGSSITLATSGVGNDLTVSGPLTTPGVAQLTSSGAITTGASNVISGTAGVTLSAATSIGTVTNFTTLAGSPANVATSGALAAAVTDDAGQINLNLVGIPTFAGAGAISLGSGAGTRTGTVVLQSAGDLNVAALPAGAISIGTGNTVSLGLSSGGTLTLPAIGSFTDAPALNLSVQGTHDVVSSGGADPRQLSVTAQDLNFTSGAAGGATTLNTSVSQLNASVGNGAALTVNESGNLTVGSIAGGAVNIGATGAISDDGNPATVIAATNGLTLAGTAIGAAGAPIGTQATSVSATASAGDVFLQQNGALLFTASATGGQVNAQTNGGSLTVSGPVSGTGVTLGTSGAGANLVLNGAVNAGTGAVSLTTNGASSDIDVNAAVAAGGAATVQSTGAVVAGAGNQITATGLTLSGSAIGSGTTALSTVAGNLTATTTNGGIFVSDAGPLALRATAVGGPVRVQAGGALNVASAAGNGVTLGAASGDLTLSGPVTAGGSDVSLTASGAGGAIHLDGAVANADNLTLAAGSVATPGAIDTNGVTIGANTITASGASFGTVGSPIKTGASSVTATASGGGIDIQDSGNLTLAANATGGAVQVSGGALTVTSASGSDVSLTASGTGNTLSLDGPINATGTAQLTAAGAILAGAGNQISAGNAVLRGAAIGSAAAPLDTTLGTLDVATTNGGIFIANTDAVTLTAAATNGAVNVQSTGGSMTVTSASGDGVTLGTGGTGSALTIASGGVDGHAGDVSLTTSGATSDITLNGAVTTTGKIAIAANGDASNVVLNVPLSSPSDISITAGSAASAGNILTSAGSNLSAPSIELVGAEIGGSTTSLNTTAANLSATSRNGGIFIVSTGALTLGAISGGTGPVSITAGGAITAAAGVTLTGGAFTAIGTSLGSAANPLNTAVSSLTTTSTNGGTFIDEADAITLNSSATGGPLNVQTTNGGITVSAASANGVTLTAGGAGSGITVNGLIAGGSGGVALKADGSVVEGAGGSVTGSSLTATGAAIGSASSALSTNVPTLTAVATGGGVYVTNQGGLTLQSIQASGGAALSALSGDLTVGSVQVGGSASLTAGSGAIVDASGNSTPLTATGLTLLADSIGAASTATAGGTFNNLRLVISANTLDATSTAGGLYIDALNGLASARVRATGGFTGNIELVAPNGDLNLMAVSASNTLLLSAGLNIYGLPGMSPITAQAAELRAGDSDPAAGHIGTLTQPLDLQLNAGNTLKVFVPSTIDTHDATRAPATLPSSGVTTTLTLFGAPSLLALEAGFGQFQGLDNGTLYTSSAESLVRSIQNQTTVVQNVVGLDWSSFDPNVSLFGTLDPPVCMPPDQRDEEPGKAGC